MLIAGKKEMVQYCNVIFVIAKLTPRKLYTIVPLYKPHNIDTYRTIVIKKCSNLTQGSWINGSLFGETRK